ncbi:MAG: alpha/beta fold hydrolase [Myxococcota bacterium]
MEQTTGVIEVLGRKIHELRGGQGRPLLYLHSAMGEAVWLPHLSALAEHYELHVPAHPGFMSSEGIEQIRNIEDLVFHYLALFDALGWDAVDVVGLSLGGWLGAEIAARYPERVSRLVLTSSVGIWIRERPIADLFALDSRHPERLRELLFHDIDAPLAQLFGSPMSELPDEVLVNVMNAFAATAKIGWNPLLHDPRLESLLPRVRARTLCLWGEKDRVVPPVYGEKFARLIPDARLEILPDCGHMLPLERPEEFVRAVHGFLG